MALAESYLAAVPPRSATFVPWAAAKLIDGDIVAAAVGGFAALLWWVLPSEGRFVVPVLCVLGAIFGLAGYTVVAEHRSGQTIGKRLMGIHVVRESGARISLGQSLIRQLPILGSVLIIIDVAFALFTEKKQRAFELITKTAPSRCCSVWRSWRRPPRSLPSPIMYQPCSSEERADQHLRAYSYYNDCR